MPVTLKQIADESRLSLMTVSCVLNGKGDLFRAETCAKVRQTADRLGYRRNSLAKAMRQGRFNSVALVLSDTFYKSALSQDYLSGIQAVLQQRDQHLIIAQLPDEKLIDDSFLPKILRESMSDGLLIHYVQDIPRQMVELLERHHVPAVWTNLRRETDCVHPDDRGASRMVTEHLLALGHRRIAYVDGTHVFDPNHARQDHYSAADRYQGYCQAMQQAGRQPQLLSDRVNQPAWRQAERMKEWLAAADRPTALVTYGSREAAAAVLAAAWLGLWVPKDLSIVTFMSSPLDVGRPITTALIPEREVGSQATRMLLEKIAEPAQLFPARAVEFTMSAAVSSVPPG